MKPWVQAASVFFSTSFAYGAPFPSGKDISVVSGSTGKAAFRSFESTSGSKQGLLTVTGPDFVTFQFTTPCSGCFGSGAQDFKLDLDITTTEHACSASAVSINGVHLQPRGRRAENGRIVIRPDRGRDLHDEILASWQLACLGEEISLLSVEFHDIDGGERVQQGQGFALSFTERDYPSLLRLQQAPLNVHSDTETRGWLTKDTASRVAVEAPPFLDGHHVPDGLKPEMFRLEDLKAQLHRLHHEYSRQERKIFNMIRHHFDACDGPQCVFQTALNQAPGFFELVKAHFRHRPATKVDHYGPHFDNFPPPFLPHEGGQVFAPFPPPPPPPPPMDGPLPDLPEPPHVFHGPDDRDPPTPPHHRRPHFHHHHPRHRLLLHIILGTVFICMLLLALIFKLLRVKKLLKDPRNRQIRASRREERHRRASYRKAACKHKWKKWWSKLRPEYSTSDYDEKRARILEQEGLLEGAMQSEIQDLQRAHELAEEIIRGEESRHRLHHEANLSLSSPRPTVFVSGNGGHSRSGQNVEHGIGDGAMRTLPPYQPPPPSYEEELEGEMVVVDGFRYSSRNSDGSHGPTDYTDSSVMELHTEMSFDTGSISSKGI